MALLSFFGNKNPDWQSLSNKGKAAMDKLDSQSAQDLFAQACELISKEKGVNNFDYVSNRFWQGSSLRRLALNEAAVKILKESYDLHQAEFESKLPRYNIVLGLADLHFDMKENESSANYYAEAAELANIYKDTEADLYYALMFKVIGRFAQLEERERSYEYALEHYEHFLVLAKEYLGSEAIEHNDYNGRQQYYTQLKTAIESQQSNYADAPVKVTYENGVEDTLERPYLEYLTSELPDAQQADLDGLFAKADKVEVYAHHNGERQLKGTIQQLDNFKKLLTIDENLGTAYVDMDGATFYFVFKTNSNELVAEIGYDEQVIFWAGQWKGDASVVDEEALSQYIKRNF